MGLESFLVRLHSKRCNPPKIADYIQRHFGAMPDPEQTPLSPAYSHFVFSDGLHVVEYELLQEGDSCEVSLRFALCHPPTVDQVFSTQAGELMRRFGFDATICEELPAGVPAVYAPGDMAQFAANCTLSIARSREYWHQMFGSEEVGLSVTAALQRFFPSVIG